MMSERKIGNAAKLGVNPYVGPRPFQRDERDFYFGREREATDLLSLVLAERLVIFYAQSGAGKSSLINTQLRPSLAAEGFHLLPIGRVSGEPPAGIKMEEIDNIFVFNLLLGLDEERHSAASLTSITLKEQLAALFPAPATVAATVLPTVQDEMPILLVIDQFEQILTTNLDAWEKREGFFRQLREAMSAEPRLWVVLSVREDYIARLDPLAHLLPGKLRTRFYMPRMTPAAALQAITNPAAKAGRAFASGVAEKLADDLSRLPGYTNTEQAAEYVEPVQLQVVCQQLWARVQAERPDASDEITFADLEKFGNVDQALINFYENGLANALEATGVNERQVRTWFERELITPALTSGLAFRSEHDTAGLPNAVVEALYNVYLIRAEQRRGDVWYELTHDRLVRPILESNRAWEKLHQPGVVQIAEQWLAENRKESLLLRSDQLAEAQTRLESEPDTFSETAREFIKASERAERQHETRRRQMLLASGLLAILVLLGLTGFAFWGLNQARKLSRLINANLLVSDSLRLVDEAPQRALLLAVEGIKGVNAQRSGNEPSVISAETDFRNLLQQVGGTPLRTYEGAFAPRVFNREATIAFSPDGKWLASANDEKIWLWAVANPTTPHILHQHKALVHALAFSPDGQWLASAGEDSIIQLWNLNDLAAKPRPLAGHEKAVLTLAFSSDGQWLASGGVDQTIRLWTMANPAAQPQVLRGHNAVVTFILFSSRGRWLASAGNDNTVRLWPLVNLAASRVLPGNSNANFIRAMAFSPDERWFAMSSGSPDTTIELWEPLNLNRQPHILNGHTAPIWGLAFSPDSKWLVSGSRDKTVRLWTIANLNAAPRILLPGHTDYVTAVAFSPDGHWLASASWDQTVRLWDVTNPAAEAIILRGHEFQIVALIFSPNGEWLASAGRDQIVRLWATANPLAEPRVLSGHTDVVDAVAFSPNGRWLASGGADKTVRLWSGANLTGTRSLTGHQGPVTAVAFSPDGHWLASGGADKIVRLWDMASLTGTYSLTGHQSAVTSVAFSPNGRWLASSSTDQTVRLWDMTDRITPRRVLTDTKSAVFAVAFSPDGQWLASGGRDRTVRLWKLPDLTETHVLTGHQASVTALAFSPDSKRLASGAGDFMVRVWDMTALTSTYVLTGHVAIVYAVAFSPDGRWLASGGPDRTIRLWDMAHPLIEPRVLHGHTDIINGLAFRPDGLWLASASADQTIRLWTVPSDALIDKACSVVGRNLTREEWVQNFPGEVYHTTCPQWPAEP